MQKLFLSAALALLTTPALAGNLAVENGWFRALPGKLPAGGYFVLTNGGSSAVTLTSAASAACGMLMLHKSETANGMSSMSDVASVPVPAGGKVTFAPGGYHLMCMGPTPAMKPGNKVPVTLKFADGKTLSAEFAVRNAAGK